MDTKPDDAIAVVTSPPARRLFGCGAVFALGATIIYLTLASPPAFGWLVAMLLFGGGLLLLAEKMRNATRAQIILYPDRLEDSDGRLLAHLDDVMGVDRGTLALKPSNGFMLKLRTKQPRRWAPGLWWSLGRYLGVGGAVGAGPTKYMAEQIALLVAKRDGEDAP